MSQEQPKSPDPKRSESSTTDAAKPEKSTSPASRMQQLQQLWRKVQPVLVTQSRNAWTIAVQAFRRFQIWWGNAALPAIRTRLPEKWNARLSNSALSGIIAAILVLLLWLPSALSPGKPAKTAKAPSSPPSAEVSPVANAPTALELAPDESLIAAIQDQVNEVTSRYADGLIQSIQANFRRSRLSVNVSEGWYSLEPARQDQLANDMLKRSQELDFDKLELLDASGTLLARSPVVGSTMVVLQRQPENQEQG
jgi:hypothetical protein